MIKFFEYQGAVYTLKDDDDQRLAYCTQVLTNTQNYNKPAYFLFHNDVSPRLKKEHPNRERGYINHLVSLEWGRLPVERQEYYRRKEKENRTREPSPDVRCQGRLKFRRTNGADDLIEYTEHQNWCHFSVTNARLAKQQARFVRDVCGNTNENGQAGATRVIEVDYLRHPDESNGLTSERASSCVGENSWIGMNGWTNGGIDEGRRIGENSWMNNQRNYSRIKHPRGYIDCEQLTEEEYKVLLERKPVTVSEPMPFRPPEVD